MPALSRARGISLLEVLISMGVVAIGLLGAISLMPLAGNSAANAALETRKGQMGRRAIDEFHTRAMNDPRSWVWVGSARSVTANNPFVGADALKNAYCIDPIYCILRSVNETLPQKPGSGPSMPRVCLRMPYANSRISLPMAREVFEERDQLAFNRPDDKTLPITQRYDSPSGTALRRTAQDKRFSWFATLVRENNLFPEKYRLSIAVCYNRVIPTGTEKVTEFAMTAVPLGNGYGGGRWEITDISQLLKAEPTRPNDTTPSLRPGEWLMLGQQRSATEQAFVWYRITDVAPFNNTTNKLTVTLDGPDWPVGYPGAGPVYATVFPGSKIYQGVVAVYEKTVTLESTPLWTN